MGVLDIGSNTGHLLVVDAHRGAAPLPAYSCKEPLRLAEHLDEGGAVSDAGAKVLLRFVREAQRLAEDKGCEVVIAFATSAIRDATNADKVLGLVRAETGLDVEVMQGSTEARLTFLAVRRWFGWSSGLLAVFDIGGGSLEVAAGEEETPQVAHSMPLGAGRLTREWLRKGPDKASIKALRRHVRARIAAKAGPMLSSRPTDRAVATSKTFRSLARICGAAPSAEGRYVRRVLSRDDLAERLPTLVSLPPGKLAMLPGVSPNRAHQIVAGAVVAAAIMDLFDLPELEICPWALREGVILERLDAL